MTSASWEDIELHSPDLNLLWHSIKIFLVQLAPNLYGDVVELGEQPIILDIGANIGAMSLVFAKAYPGATIHAVEASSYNYPYLVKSTKRFRIYPQHFAAHDEDGELEIAMPHEDQRPIVNSGEISVYGKGDGHRETVIARRLDTAFERADFIKIDTEGHTLSVLRGASRIIAESRPILQIESSPTSYRMAGVTAEDLREHFQKIGYEARYWLKDLKDVLYFPV